MEAITNHRSCFSEEELAYIAESIQKGYKSSLPPDISNHLSSCNNCAGELLMILESIESRKKNKRLNINKKSLYLTITFSSVAALFGAGLFIFHLAVNENTSTGAKPRSDLDENITITENTKNHSSTSNVANTASTNNSDQKTTSFSDIKFEPCPDLEKLILRNSIALRGSNKLFTVSENNHFTPPVKIEIPNQSTQEFQILILNNKNQLIFETTFCCREFIIPELEKGLFYYKILNNEDDLLYVGKIRSK